MDKFLIAPINQGIKLDVVPFMAPEDSFRVLKNVYIHHGSIIRKPTAVLVNTADVNGLSSRLRDAVDTTDVLGDATNTVPGGFGAIGQQFSIGTDTFTVYQANGDMNQSPAAAAATATFNTATGVFAFVGADPFENVYWYPSHRVHEVTEYSSQTITKQEIVFDNQFAYAYGVNEFIRIDGAASIWVSTNDSLYSSESFLGATSGSSVLLVANNVDLIKYYNGATFTDFIPAFLRAANNNVRNCRLIKDFAGRLLLLNTTEYEGGVALDVFHNNRIRWSEYGNIFAADSWYQAPQTNDKGGFVDLPIDKVITACEILNNRLIVFCEDSTWELVPTGNKIDPFQVNLIDDTTGSTAIDAVEVNNSLLFINHNGIFVCDGINVRRLDDRLSGLFPDGEYRYTRIYKDEISRLIYISISYALNSSDITRVVVYNYENDTFSYNIDMHCAYGKLFHDDTGGSIDDPPILVGNQHGYMRTIEDDENKSGISSNIISIVKPDAANMNLTIYNHAFGAIQFPYIRIENSALAGLNGSYEIKEVIDADTIRIENTNSEVGYAGDANVAAIDELAFQTKEFNPYLAQGAGVSINKIMFNVNRTAVNSKIDVQNQISGSSIRYVIDDEVDGSLALDTIGYNATELLQDRVWRYVYTLGSSDTIALTCRFNEETLLSDTLSYQDFSINAIMLFTEPTNSF